MAEALRPGFKAEAEAIAQLVRAELDLGVLDALDCFALAETWGIPVVSLGELRDVSVELLRWRVNHTGVVRQVAGGR